MGKERMAGSRPGPFGDDDEDWVVAQARSWFPALKPGAGIGDDAAVLALGNVVTTDTMVEGVHWDERLSPADVGWKLVAVNVSDVGAMGGRPQWATLALTLPRPLDRAWVASFFGGLAAGLQRYGVRLVGGDTTRGGGRVATLAVGGEAKRPVLRSGAHAGDVLWVTGELGRSAAAFLRSEPPVAAMAWFRRPMPPVEFGAALADAGLVSAMLDLSDGLAIDLHRLCRASGVGAAIDVASLPTAGTIEEAVAFGEDYELLFAAPAEHEGAICSLAAMTETVVSKVGIVTTGQAVCLSRGEWPTSLFRHFGGESA